MLKISVLRYCLISTSKIKNQMRSEVIIASVELRSERGKKISRKN